MHSTREEITKELNNLITAGYRLVEKDEPDNHPDLISDYHKWYTRALSVVLHLLPDRLAEFKTLYEGKNTKSKAIKDYTMMDYTIADYLQGLRITKVVKEQFDVFPKTVDAFNHHNLFISKFAQQLGILSSAKSRLDDILSNISGVLKAQLFDSETDAARELCKNGHFRAAGAVAGVVLESHLSTVAKNHSVAVKKKNPHINDWNDVLKQNNVIDLQLWRKIQHLADIRNLCTHKKSKEPKEDEVEELINGVEKITKTLV